MWVSKASNASVANPEEAGGGRPTSSGCVVRRQYFLASHRMPLPWMARAVLPNCFHFQFFRCRLASPFPLLFLYYIHLFKFYLNIHSPDAATRALTKISSLDAATRALAKKHSLDAATRALAKIHSIDAATRALAKIHSIDAATRALAKIHSSTPPCGLCTKIYCLTYLLVSLYILSSNSQSLTRNMPKLHNAYNL